MITHHTGNLFDIIPRTGTRGFAHIVNLSGKYSAGFAKQVAERYPLARAYYTNYLQYATLGDVDTRCLTSSSSYGRSDLYVSHLFCMRDVYNARTNPQPLSMVALRVALRHLSTNFGSSIPVYMPMIGAGLARGPWDEILALLTYEFRNGNLHICKLEAS